MALVASSDVLNELNATPRTYSNSGEIGGGLRRAMGFLTAANYVAGTAGQWYAFTRVPARAIVHSIKQTNISSGAAGSVKLGLFRPNGGIAIDDDCFSTAIDLNAARQAGEVATLPLAGDRYKTLAAAFATAVGTAGATSDVEYDVVATVVTAATAGKDTLIEVLYTLGD